MFIVIRNNHASIEKSPTFHVQSVLGNLWIPSHWSESGGDLFVGVAGFAHGANILAVW